MRKILLTLTIIILIISIVGTGVIVYIDSTIPVAEESTIIAQ